MKTRSPFLALVKFELFRLWHNFGTPGYLMWVLWFALSLMPAIFLIGGLSSNNPDYGDVFFVVMGVWAGVMFGWLFLLGFQCSFALMREARSVFPLSTVPDDHADEFFGTRAVNPRILFRAKTLALAVVIIAPLLVNVAASLPFADYFLLENSHGFVLRKLWPRQPSWILEPNGFGYGDLDEINQAKNLVMFIGSVPREAAVIERGPTVFAIWLSWGAVAVITLVQGYYGLVSRFLAKQSQRMAAFAAALVPGASLLALPLFLASDRRPCQEAFIFFAEHPLPLTLALGLLAIFVQRFCERRFAEQEVL